MKKLLISFLASISLIFCTAIFAAHGGGGGNGMGNAKGFGHGSFSTGLTGNVPPGLNKSDHYPHGLAKKGKIPAGWSKGKKEGWENEKGITPIVPVVPEK